jgi:hypothetical protein
MFVEMASRLANDQLCYETMRALRDSPQNCHQLKWGEVEMGVQAEKQS